jgi:curli production assembly/transport component CsgG
MGQFYHDMRTTPGDIRPETGRDQRGISQQQENYMKSVQTGEVLLTVNTQKTLLSYTAGVAIFKFYDNGTKNFESEIGLTQTEASIHCIKSATDLAVEQLIIQGEKKGMWHFKEKSNEK